MGFFKLRSKFVSLSFAFIIIIIVCVVGFCLLVLVFHVFVMVICFFFWLHTVWNVNYFNMSICCVQDLFEHWVFFHCISLHIVFSFLYHEEIREK
jgi:hypothetical protein